MSNETAMSVYLSNDNTKKYLNSILGERSGQFITSLTSLAGSSEMLKNCDRNSLHACALKAVFFTQRHKELASQTENNNVSV